MVRIDMPMPENCADCPCSYWIQSGSYEGLMMCQAMEARDRMTLRESAGDMTENYLVNEWDENRPINCPIAGEV